MRWDTGRLLTGDWNTGKRKREKMEFCFSTSFLCTSFPNQPFFEPRGWGWGGAVFSPFFLLYIVVSTLGEGGREGREGCRPKPKSTRRPQKKAGIFTLLVKQ